jgi:phosphoribosylformylglycinamidine synthase subunit PurQ / glutaminase
MTSKILILHASGANRDGEAARACELAGGTPEVVHLNQLRMGRVRLEDYGVLLLPGGFSYGDALGAGVRLALDMQVFLHDALNEYIQQDRLVLGICNGFQALVKAGLLPGPNVLSGDGSTTRSVTLTENARGHFECRWVHLSVNRQSPATYLHQIDDLIFCPVSHGEGNFQVANQTALESLEAQQLVAFRYVDADGSPAGGRYPLNPNGSVADIAGISNPRGNVVGLMPHPEDHVVAIQNPLHHGEQAQNKDARMGLALFRAVINTMLAVA